MCGLLEFIRSSVGKKAIVAVSGVFLFLWLGLHVLGNVTAFAGAEAMDSYAAGLRRAGPLLWIMRIGLVTTALVHIYGTVSLRVRARAAKPSSYMVRESRGATIASRTMAWGGGLLLAFVLYHVLHLTVGVVHPQFRAGRVYDNLVTGLGMPVVAGVYVGAATLVALHLFHGLWAMPKSLGMREAKSRRLLVFAIAAAVGVGFAALPIAVVGGILR